MIRNIHTVRVKQDLIIKEKVLGTLQDNIPYSALHCIKITPKLGNFFLKLNIMLFYESVTLLEKVQSLPSKEHGIFLSHPGFGW